MDISFVFSCLSFFNLFINLLYCSHRMSAFQICNICLTFAVVCLALFYSNLRILNLIFLILLFGLNMIVSKPLLIISNVAEFCADFNLSIIVLCVFLPSTLIISNPDISSINEASTFINLCSFGCSTLHSFGKIGMDLFKKLKQWSHEFIKPSNTNIFLIPKIRSIFSCISNTKV